MNGRSRWPGRRSLGGVAVVVLFGALLSMGVSAAAGSSAVAGGRGAPASSPETPGLPLAASVAPAESFRGIVHATATGTWAYLDHTSNKVLQRYDPTERRIVVVPEAGTGQTAVVQYYDTGRRQLSEVHGGHPVLGHGSYRPGRADCFAWTVNDMTSLYFGYLRFGDNLVVHRSEWGEPMRLLSSREVTRRFRDAEWFKYEAFTRTVDYGDRTIELDQAEGGFLIRFGEIVREYLLDVDALAPSDGNDAPTGDDSETDWSAWLIGTDGEHLGIEVVPHERECPLRYVMILSLRDGTVVSCTAAFGSTSLYAGAGDSATWLDEVRLPPSGILHDRPCPLYDGDLASLAGHDAPAHLTVHWPSSVTSTTGWATQEGFDESHGSPERMTHTPVSFSGIIHSDALPSSSGSAAPRLQYFDTTQARFSELVETRLNVHPCLAWNAPSAKGTQHGLQFGYVDTTASHSGDLVVVDAAWGSPPEPLHRSAYDEEDYLRRSLALSWSYAVAIGDAVIELIPYDNGFGLRYGDLTWSYLTEGPSGERPPAPLLTRTGPAPIPHEPTTDPEVLHGDGTQAWWSAGLVGTNGELLGIQILSNDATRCPQRYLYVVSLRAGAVLSCTVTRGRFSLIANHATAPLDEVKLPPSQRLYEVPCTAYDGNLPAVVGRDYTSPGDTAVPVNPDHVADAPTSIGMAPSASFVGLVLVDTAGGSPWIRYYDTRRSQLSEMALPQLRVLPCTAWIRPELSQRPRWIDFGFRDAAITHVDDLVVVHAEWRAAPEVRHHALIDEEDFFPWVIGGLRDSSQPYVKYGQWPLELRQFDNGIAISHADVRGEYLVELSVLTGAVQSDTLSRDTPVELTGDGSNRSWTATLAGTNGDLLGIEILLDEPVECPQRFLVMISLRDGTVLTCTKMTAGTGLIDATGARRLDTIKVPPTGHLVSQPCVPFDGNLESLAGGEF